MNIRADLPRRTRAPEHVWIPLADGCRLSAKIWLPEDAETDPVPAILEYLPYRKSDGTVPRDEGVHAYFAGHGYAGVRVDIRGTGDSEGMLWDEYTRQEQDDAVEVIAWLAARPWSNGNVGMMGISWGGFNALQVAARRPPALKAIISVCSTDDRYANDEHYIGGCVMGPEMQSYATMLFGYATHAPDPTVVGDRWREMWRERLDAAGPALPAWLSHQLRDDYWRHGSVCEDYDAMQCAVFMVGGWADGYRDAVLRMLEHYRGPVKALIGPWCHAMPHVGAPGPAIGFLQEALRWWDHWLKGIDTGIMDEPAARFWMPDAAARLRDRRRHGRQVADRGRVAARERRDADVRDRAGWARRTAVRARDDRQRRTHHSAANDVPDHALGRPASRHLQQPPDDRYRGRLLDLLVVRGRLTRRPAPRRRALAGLRLTAARREPRDPGAGDRRARRRLRPARGARRGAALRRRRDRRLDAGRARRPQPVASREPRRTSAARGRYPLPGRSAFGGRRLLVRRRAPPQAGALDEPLAARLAVSAPGDDDRVRRREPAGSAGAGGDRLRRAARLPGSRRGCPHRLRAARRGHQRDRRQSRSRLGTGRIGMGRSGALPPRRRPDPRLRGA